MARFLVIRFSSIGDIILTSPVLRCLKEQGEEVEIAYLTKKQYYPVLKANPFIDHFYLLDKDLDGLIDEIKYQHFDYIIDLHRNLRSSKVIRKLGMYAFRVDKLNIKKWLYVNFKWNKLPDKHIVDRYLDTVRVFDIQNDHKGLDYFIPEDERIDLNVLPSSFREKYIAMVIGGGKNTKKLPREKLALLCSKIDAPIVLLGGPEDRENGDYIAKKTGCTVFNTCGDFRINQSADLVKHSALVVAHDTGLMHAAAAFKKNVLSIWGNTDPAFGMYPYMAGEDSEIFEVKNMACRPCSKIGFDKCPKKHFNCMENQNLDEIAKKARTLFYGKEGL